MKKYLWVSGLVLSSLLAGTVAAGSSPAQQQRQQQGLASGQQSNAPRSLAPSPILTASPSAARLCQGTYCRFDSDCYAACPGGEGSSYCDPRQHECYPY
jgi:hypothetical protein